MQLRVSSSSLVIPYIQALIHGIVQGTSKIPFVPPHVPGVASVPRPTQPSETSHEIGTKKWRALGKARCAFLWDAIPAGFLNPHLETGGKWLVLLRATLDWLKYLQRTHNYPTAPAGLPECDLGLLTGRKSADINEGRRLERVEMRKLMAELPHGYGWGLIQELGGDPQDRVLYLTHRYIEEILEKNKEDELMRAYGLKE